MTTSSAPTAAERVTCSVIGPQNAYGKPRLIATISEQGIFCWCGHCKRPHLVTREKIEQAWNDFKASYQEYAECVE